MKSPGKKGGSKKGKAPDMELKKMADEIKRMSLANNQGSSGGLASEKDKDSSLPTHLQAIKIYQEPLPLSKNPGGSSKQRIMTMNAHGGAEVGNPDPINIEVKNSDLFAGNSQAVLSQSNQKEDEEAN